MRKGMKISLQPHSNPGQSRHQLWCLLVHGLHEICQVLGAAEKHRTSCFNEPVNPPMGPVFDDEFSQVFCVQVFVFRPRKSSMHFFYRGRAKASEDHLEEDDDHLSLTVSPWSPKTMQGRYGSLRDTPGKDEAEVHNHQHACRQGILPARQLSQGEQQALQRAGSQDHSLEARSQQFLAWFRKFRTSFDPRSSIVLRNIMPQL